MKPWFVEWKLGDDSGLYVEYQHKRSTSLISRLFHLTFVSYLSELLTTREDCRKSPNFIHTYFGHCLRHAAPPTDSLYLHGHAVKGTHSKYETSSDGAISFSFYFVAGTGSTMTNL